MKKTYIAPKAQMIELEAGAIMECSINQVMGDGVQLEGRNRVILWGDDEEE